MRWRLILEEFGPKLKYIKGANNIVADALSRLNIQKYADNNKPTNSYLAEQFAFDSTDLPKNALPISFKTIMVHQQKDKKLLKLVNSSTGYSINSFHGIAIDEQIWEYDPRTKRIVNKC